MLILCIIYYLISTITVLEVVAIIFQITKFIAIKRGKVHCPLQQNYKLEETNLNPDLVTWGKDWFLLISIEGNFDRLEKSPLEGFTLWLFFLIVENQHLLVKFLWTISCLVKCLTCLFKMCTLKTGLGTWPSQYSLRTRVWSQHPRKRLGFQWYGWNHIAGETETGQQVQRSGWAPSRFTERFCLKK